MSDFKFICSNCGQHLTGDVRYAGLQINCPTCGQPVMVPTAPPPTGVAVDSGGPPIAPIRPQPTPQQPQTCGLAIASLICSIGSFVIIPFGFIPGIICGHMAKKKIAANPGLGGSGLAKAGLIIGYIGLVINVLVILAVAAFIVLFAARAQHTPMPGRPPRPGMRVQPRVTIPVEKETKDTEPDGSGWTMKLDDIEIPAGTVKGRVHGEPFKIDKVILEGSWLKFSEGTGFLPDRGLEVVTFKDSKDLSGRTFTVPKKEFGGNPHIWMKWKEGGGNMPRQRTFTDRYAMRLEFGQLSGGKLPGKIYLCLPDEEKSFIAGTFEAQVRGAR